jgi:hypothetical protein
MNDGDVTWEEYDHLKTQFSIHKLEDKFKNMER